MSKRTHPYDTSTSRPPKRPRPEFTSDPTPLEEIHFARQLRDLLAFQQNDLPTLRSGLASVKTFLESIFYHKYPDDRARQLSILREYLDTQKPTDPKDANTEPFLQSLWQSLSFALSSNPVNDPLTSSLVSLLALLLKTLSSVLDLSEYGLLLARTVLEGRHLSLLRRCLEAPRQKEFLIGPAVRLLGEVLGFDGGVLAREVYRRREVTAGWSWVRKGLGMGKDGVPTEELQRRPAIRTLTVRYVLSFLKYLHEGGKADLLQNGALCRALFQNLRDDPPDLIIELLTVTEQHVFKDEELKRSAKAALLVEKNLERVTAVATQSPEDTAATLKAYVWLTAVCTTPLYGVLRHSGWYPPSTTHLERRRLEDDTIDLGLDSIDFYDREERPAVRNTVLLSWIQTLHPWLNLQERELILTCFRSAPELVAAYFVEKDKSMQLEPKLSNTWIGYASFLFEVVQLPVPDYLGHGKEWAVLPPQTTIMVESILPRPLTQKVLSRCLNQSSELITFFAVRILVLALEKLCTVRKELAKAAEASEQHSALWNEASERLLERFVDRAPPIKDVIAAFRKIPDDDEHALQREAATRLLRLYFEHTPLQALEEQFDVSNALTAALRRAQRGEGKSQMTELRALELEHLLQIARLSPGMRWFGKQGGLTYSPVTTLLQLHVKEPKNGNMRALIQYVMESGQVLSGDGDVECLVASLREPSVQGDVVVLEFLDDCFRRANQKPVKYLDDLAEIWRLQDGQTPSLLCAALLEQAPFLVQKPGNVQAMRMVGMFLTLVGHRTASQEVADVASEILRKRIQKIDGWIDQGVSNKGRMEDVLKLLEEIRIPQTANKSDQASTENQEDTFTPPFHQPVLESENHPELLMWAKKDLDMALEDGDISALTFCLCSQYPDIRTQALAQLRKLEVHLLNSNLEDKDPIYVLIGELIETYEQNYLSSEGRAEPKRLEYIAGAFVAAALRVQMLPTHFLYPKLNQFLNKDPEWRVHKLPTYWIQNTILSSPDISSSSDQPNDKTYWLEARWVLDFFVDGLRTPADLEILRRAGVFERFMALFAAPGCERVFREKVLELLWRACQVEGGGGREMLVKRVGVLGWLDVVKPSGKGVEGWLRREVMQGLGGEGGSVETWAGVGVEEM